MGVAGLFAPLLRCRHQSLRADIHLPGSTVSESFDPYRQWLGIDEPTRPLDHYRLLGLTRFEGNPQAIAHAADIAMAKVRKIRPGQHAAEWGRLLDQLGAAKVCLLDPNSKATYDASLRSGDAVGQPTFHRRTLLRNRSPAGRECLWRSLRQGRLSGREAT